MNLDDLPQDQQTVLGAIERFAHRSDRPAYLVGGAVRDALLGRRIRDVDVAVEGDAIGLAREVAANLPVALRTHEAFGTAVLISESGRRTDLGRTRAEHYSGVAALPTIRPATLAEDLVRRDFSVNSMAVPLSEPDLTAPIDPAGGRGDLDARVLRVHHTRSFLDDPTRILRGARFEARLGFEFEADTERLAREAVAEQALDALSSERLRAELELVVSEEVPARDIWTRLDSLGVCAALGLATGERTAEMLERVTAACAEWESHFGGERRLAKPALLVAALVLAQAPQKRAAPVDRLSLRGSRLSKLDQLAAAIVRPRVAPHEVAATLGPLAEDELLPIAALGGPASAARVYGHLETQRELELRIDGSTLLARGFAPGPRIGEALEATRDARLDGRLEPEEELAFAVGLLEDEGGG